MTYSVTYTEPVKGFEVVANFGRDAERAAKFAEKVGGEVKTVTRRGRRIPLTEIGRKLLGAMTGREINHPKYAA